MMAFRESLSPKDLVANQLYELQILRQGQCCGFLSVRFLKKERVDYQPTNEEIEQAERMEEEHCGGPHWETLFCDVYKSFLEVKRDVRLFPENGTDVLICEMTPNPDLLFRGTVGVLSRKSYTSSKELVHIPCQNKFNIQFLFYESC
jgi:hypothetical protein